MAKLGLLVLVFGLSALITAASINNISDNKKGGGGEPVFDCTGKDGYFADTYRRCHVFYRCLPDGQKWTFTCIEDDQFDNGKQTCLRNGEADCPEYIPIAVANN